MKSVTDFNDYKEFLRDSEDSRKSFERGFRTKLAEFIGCQSGYISHVLNNSAHFSLEQGLRAAVFLRLSPLEKKYFLLLIEFARAGTQELKQHFQDDLKLLREQHLDIKERVGETRALSEIEQSTYYSSWHYIAAHVLTSLPQFNDVKSIAEALRISDEAVRNVVLFLLDAGILKEQKGGLSPGLTQIHLNRESPLVRQHHTNMRISAIQSLANDSKSDVHYSTLSTMAKADAEKLKSEMLQLIQKYVEIVRPSADEVMYAFNLDFYSMLET